jgi:hypothetical protein
MVDDSGIFSPEGILPSPVTILLSYDMDDEKVVQEIYPVAWTPLVTDIEFTMLSEVNVSLTSSGLNESDLDDTLKVVDYLDLQKPEVETPKSRRSGRKTKVPDRLGISEVKK